MEPAVQLYTDLLPFEGMYFPRVKAETPWNQNTINIYGRDIYEPRLTAMYGDVDYTYSNSTKKSMPWTPLISELKAIVEEAAGYEFNTCLLNYYRDGADSIGLHADDEPELGENPTIATLSLGGARRFEMLSNCGAFNYNIILQHGDLLVMSSDTQMKWKHRIQKSNKNTQPRISLTFRKVYSEHNS